MRQEAKNEGWLVIAKAGIARRRRSSCAAPALCLPVSRLSLVYVKLFDSIHSPNIHNTDSNAKLACLFLPSPSKVHAVNEHLQSQGSHSVVLHHSRTYQSSIFTFASCALSSPRRFSLLNQVSLVLLSSRSFVRPAQAFLVLRQASSSSFNLLVAAATPTGTGKEGTVRPDYMLAKTLL